jgi:hypothetical protein
MLKESIRIYVPYFSQNNVFRGIFGFVIPPPAASWAFQFARIVIGGQCDIAKTVRDLGREIAREYTIA